MAPLTGTPAPAFRDRRRAAVAGSGTQRGLDHARAERRADGRWLLTLFFVPSAAAQKPSVPPGIGRENVRLALAGGTAETGLVVEGVEPGGLPDALGVRLAQSGALPEPVPGEPLTYLVELLDVRNLDRFFTAAPFTLEADLPTPIAPPPPRALPRAPAAPAIDYMAKDYASLRQLMLERMTLAIPGWTERNPSDYGIAALEVLAYAGDYLSYYQDAVATEAYLATARRRVSVRRHARLVDYRLNEGLNARAWLAVEVSGEAPEEEVAVELPQRTGVLTQVPDLAPVVGAGWATERWARGLGTTLQVFETMAPATLKASQNAMRIYLWGAVELTLPAGTTSVALQGHPTLAEGDVLILESRAEPADPETGYRPFHAVRLNAAPVAGCDSTWPGSPEITEISWFAEDALPAPLVVSVYRDGVQAADLATVRGNVVPVDHGRTVWEELPPVAARGAYRPALSQPDLTVRVPFDAELARRRPASEALEQDPLAALPAVVLYELPGYEAAAGGDGSAAAGIESIARRGRRWEARYDLLSSGRFDRHFVVEMEEDGSADLRFGDGENGERPVAGSRFWAVYRVGSGTKGNVGPGSLRHLVVAGAAEEEALWNAITTVENPMQATGGAMAEPIEQVRRLAPRAFYAQDRCVTEEDFADAARAVPGVLAAVARLGFTGSWETAFVHVQRPGGRALDADFERRLRAALAPRLVAGYELAVAGPCWVPIEIVLKIELARGTPAEPVRQALSTRLGSRELPDGGRAYFYPDRFTFGQPLYLSEVVARAAETPGVAWVEPLRFQRWGQPPRGELAAGRIDVGPLEIVRVESRPGAPQLGSITFRLEAAR